MYCRAMFLGTDDYLMTFQHFKKIQTFCTALYTAYNLMKLLIYTYLIFTFYVNTICLTPNSQFIFVLGCR